MHNLFASKTVAAYFLLVFTSETDIPKMFGPPAISSWCAVRLIWRAIC